MQEDVTPRLLLHHHPPPEDTFLHSRLTSSNSIWIFFICKSNAVCEQVVFTHNMLLHIFYHSFKSSDTALFLKAFNVTKKFETRPFWNDLMKTYVGTEYICIHYTVQCCSTTKMIPYYDQLAITISVWNSHVPTIKTKWLLRTMVSVARVTWLA